MPWTSYIISANELADAVLQSKMMGKSIRIRGLNAPLADGDAPMRVEPSELSDIIEEMRKDK